MPTKAQTARNRLAVAARTGDNIQRETARADLAAANIEQYIERTVAKAPPLSREQMELVLSAFVGMRISEAA